MYVVSILESRPVLSSFLSASLPESLRQEIDLCSAQGMGPGQQADLLVVSPDLAERDIHPPACRAVLVPGRLSPLARDIPAQWAVSYGISPKDSLTLSSLGEDAISLALQREVVTLGGSCLECQELCLPHGGHRAPMHVLACAGVQLMLGVPPEQVSVGPVSSAPDVPA